jgi:hypothetical protein
VAGCEVITPSEMLRMIQDDPDDYIVSGLENDENLWEQFNDWCIEVLDCSLFSN